MDTLPPDIISHIGGFLQDPLDRLRFAHACKTSRTALEHTIDNDKMKANRFERLMEAYHIVTSVSKTSGTWRQATFFDFFRLLRVKLSVNSRKVFRTTVTVNDKWVSTQMPI